MSDFPEPQWVSKLDAPLYHRWRQGRLPENAPIPSLAETLARIATDSDEDVTNRLVGAGRWPEHAICTGVRCRGESVECVAEISGWLSKFSIVTRVIPRFNIVYVTLPAEAIYYVACDERVETIGEEEVYVITSI